MRQLVLLAILLLYGTTTNARIKGRIIEDGEGVPVPGAVVSYIQLPDSVVFKAAMTDDKGVYMLDVEDGMPGLLRVSCLGYATALYNVKDDMTICLTPVVNSLQEVTVSSSSFSTTPNGYMFRPGKLTKVAPKAWDILSYTPLIKIDKNRIVLDNRGPVKIYINGRDPEMPADAVMQMLSTLSSDQIDRIVVVTSPGSSSSEDAFVNIYLKDGYTGILGSLNIGAEYYMQRLGHNEGIWLGTSYNNWRMSAYVSYRKIASKAETEVENLFHSTETTVREDVVEDRRSHQLTGNICFSYYDGKKWETGLSASLSGAKYSFVNSTRTDISNTNSVIPATETILSRHASTMPWCRPLGNISAFSTLLIGPNRSYLDMTINLSNNQSDINSSYTESGMTYSRTDDSSDSRGVVSKIQYVLIWKDGAKLTTGYNFIASNLKDRRITIDEWQRFDYTEISHAAFTDYSRKIGRVNVSLGFRGLWLRHLGRQSVNEERFLNTQFIAMPSANISMNLPHEQMLSIGFGTSARQPYYFMLNPFSTRLTNTSYSSGNPNLKSGTDYSVDLRYRFLKYFSLNGYYSWENNGFNQITVAGDDDTTFLTYLNNASSRFFRLQLTYDNTFFENRLRVGSELYFSHSRLKMDAGLAPYSYRSSSWKFDQDVSWVFNTANYLSAGIEFSYMAPFTNEEGRNRDDVRLSFNIKKDFPFGGRLILAGNCILNGDLRIRRFSEIYDTYMRKKNLPLGVYLTFSYTFGSYKVKAATQRDGGTERFGTLEL